MADDASEGMLRGGRLLIAGFALAVANFMVVLDTTIANVSVPHISGSLGIAGSQGTWVITSYAVAEAICVPLTGWLTNRFGSVRVFFFSTAGFAIFSLLCGLSGSLAMLVVCRIGQGFCGGPIMPLTQTLMLRIFPPKSRAQASGLWAMTTVVGPVLGPVLGGLISDNWSWNWIFFINLPVAALCLTATWKLLRNVETATRKLPIDTVGLALLVVWIGALQVMLDLGRDHDWFADGFIVKLGLVAVIGFAAFLAWELTQPNPIVDLRVFRHRGFTVSVISLSVSFAVFFSVTVLVPQILQNNFRYTATWAGYASAPLGIAAIILSPVVAMLTTKVDSRALVCFGIVWMGMTCWMRSRWNTDADFWTLALPQLVQGVGIPFFFVPVTAIALAAVDPAETAGAAGLMNFLRTMSGAIATSLITSMTDDQTRIARTELVGTLNSGPTVAALSADGSPLDQARAMIDTVVDGQAAMLASNHIFLLSAVLMAGSALVIWGAPRPRRTIEPGSAH
ncbi:DHA2 family efflux MFS transporter permease subunit [Sphingomonas sp. MMS24-J13]|uniref:DHA2 family efflux MFS transporter permease subunit n=1 Tax=Sphingomonas sp. MMS24-J13 TaxID=3238686 RepID=UPI0038504ED9